MEDQVRVCFFAGKLDIPPEMQLRLGLHEGSSLSLRVEEGRLIGETIRPARSKENIAAREELSRLRDVISRGPSLCDALIAYRREDRDSDRRSWRQ